VMMMMMMKLPILPCAEKLELVLSTAPKHEMTPTKTVKIENGSISRGNQSRDVYGKRSMGEKIYQKVQVLSLE